MAFWHLQTQEFLNGARWENAKWSRVLMKRMHHHRIAPGDTDSWTEERIKVPDVTDSHLYGCYSIDVSYTITVRYISTVSNTPNGHA